MTQFLHGLIFTSRCSKLFLCKRRQNMKMQDRTTNSFKAWPTSLMYNTDTDLFKLSIFYEVKSSIWSSAKVRNREQWVVSPLIINLVPAWPGILEQQVHGRRLNRVKLRQWIHLLYLGHHWSRTLMSSMISSLMIHGTFCSRATTMQSQLGFRPGIRQNEKERQLYRGLELRSLSEHLTIDAIFGSWKSRPSRRFRRIENGGVNRTEPSLRGPQPLPARWSRPTSTNRSSSTSCTPLWSPCYLDHELWISLDKAIKDATSPQVSTSFANSKSASLLNSRLEIPAEYRSTNLPNTPMSSEAFHLEDASQKAAPVVAMEKVDSIALDKGKVTLPSDHAVSSALLVGTDGHVRKIPVPSDDPNDPLNFLKWQKYGIIICCCWFCKFACFVSDVSGAMADCDI